MLREKPAALSVTVDNQMLSDGTTPVTEKLSVTQPTELMFVPAASGSGFNSSVSDLTYNVSDPAEKSTNGGAIRAVGPAKPSLTGPLDRASPQGTTITSVVIKREIAFIDRNVDDLCTLLAGIRPDVEPILLSDVEPAPQQMARAVKGRGDLEAIHVIAHGRPGEVSFGAGALSLETVEDYAIELAEVGLTLCDGAIQLWTCESGQGKRGVAFVYALARASGAQVAASTQLIGATARGGCWGLTHSSGDTAVKPPLTTAGMAGYTGVLAAVSWKNPGTSGNWSVGSNWTGGTGPGGVPGSADDVTIGAGSSSYVVTVNTAALANSLKIASQIAARLQR
jgi:hypothetical protein